MIKKLTISPSGKTWPKKSRVTVISSVWNTWAVKPSHSKGERGLFKINDVLIELLEPLTADSPISQFIEKKGGGLHHLALEVDDIQNEIGRLQGKNVQMLDQQPRTGAHHAKIAFVHPKSFSGVLFELKQQGMSHKTRLAILWHMHQPFYKNPQTETFRICLAAPARP